MSPLERPSHAEQVSARHMSGEDGHSRLVYLKVGQKVHHGREESDELYKPLVIIMTRK